MSLTQSKRLSFVDGLRGIAAVAVLFDHLPGMFGNPTARSAFTQRVLVEWGYYGKLGVDVFFVLSGFVITLTLAKASINWGYFWRFAGRRSLRLDPPYWASLAICCGLLLLRRDAFHSDVELPTWGQIGAHLIYLQGLLGYRQINSVFWTLCIEIQLYLVFCAFQGALQWRRSKEQGLLWCSRGTLVAFVGSLAWPAGLIGGEGQRVTLLPFMCEFLAGSIAYWFSAGQLRATTCIAAGSALVCLGLGYRDPSAVTAGCTALLLIAASARGALTRWLALPSFQRLGKISYSLYLVHVPTFLVVLGLRTRLPGGESEGVGWLLCLVALGAALAIATVFYAVVERPSLKLSHRLALAPRRRRSEPDGPAVAAGSEQ